MDTNLLNLTRILYPNIKIYDVLKEAIMNSIQANATKIDINLISDKELFTSLNKSHELIGITVTDNGDGLTQDNINAFFEIATDHKEKIGGKGIGRIAFLKIAKHIHIKSATKDSELIEFNFSYNTKAQSIKRTKSDIKDTFK